MAAIIAFLVIGGWLYTVARENRLNSGLFSAVKQHNLAAVQYWLDRGADPSTKQSHSAFLYDVGNASALVRAAQNGDMAIVKALVSRGADIETSEYPQEITPLIAASSGGHIDIVKFLIEKGARINRRDLHGETAFIWAAKCNHFDVVNFLAHAGAQTNIKSKDGITALDWANDLHNKRMVEYLNSLPGN